jgi:energy-converting hydrogenase Eha subunit A
VTHLQGWAGVALGVSILAIGFTPVVPEILGGVLVLVAMVGYLAGAVLFVYSTYLSRRVAR